MEQARQQAGQGSRLRIGVAGAGAIGGFLAARLALAGHEVSVLARGATLAAIRTRGILLDSGGTRVEANVRASDDPAQLGVQDVVILAVKAPSLPGLAPAIAPLLGPGTIVLPALNGVPWWFFPPGAGGPLAGRQLRTVDPDGRLERALPAAHILGLVVFPSCSCPEPGTVVHASGSRLVVGEPAGGMTLRAQAMARLLADARFEASASPDIRRIVWEKLLGNACFNPVSLLTGSHTDLLIDDAGVNRLFQAMMHELLTIGRELGIALDIEPADRLAVTRKLGHIKTSMLQDVEAGRAVELDAILGAAVEIAAELRVPAPLLDTVYALARVRAQRLGLYPVARS
ncbi:MAG: 2-dehydropantoate 2-reductase [Pigmentiphaga sp.]|uniref:ketopantoate reductase family protein n=1 Tax=Pigmentiphaga sp. TaxID=1977564 RepID=UPI0029A562CE|nr:2-dehydropantoate 2-reductase [Pigmentiphaga sp.]MDX3907017.1 2-dehydropantoate 2-reductase [Pigmentiphaga sp.]